MKYLALDIGQVLCEVSFDSFVNILTKYNILPNNVKAFDFCENIARYLDIGITDINQEVLKLLNAKGYSYQNFCFDIITEWDNVIKPCSEMTELLKKLISEQDYCISLLSNIGYDHAKLLRETFPGVYNQCIQHFSCEVGARKPSKLFFQSFLMENPDFRSCLFIDDRLENIAAANNAGFDAIYFNIADKKDKKSAALELEQIVLD